MSAKPKVLSPGLIVWGNFLWSKRTARKTTECALTGLPINRGDPVYAPVTDGDARMLRIVAAELEEAVRP